jgi:hypothetical protein
LSVRNAKSVGGVLIIAAIAAGLAGPSNADSGSGNGCCRNNYYLNGTGLCSGPSMASCDSAPTQNASPGSHPNGYRASGCTTYSGSFATGRCDDPPGAGSVKVPGYSDAGGNCCWFSGSTVFEQKGTDQVQNCNEGSC